MSRTILIALLAAFAASCNRSAPANVAASVNGRPITYADLDKQFQSSFATPTDKESGDQIEIQKLEVLRTLVDGEIMLQEGEHFLLQPTVEFLRPGDVPDAFGIGRLSVDLERAIVVFGPRQGFSCWAWDFSAISPFTGCMAA